LRGIATRALDVAADFDNFADLWDPLVTGDSPLGEYAGSLPRTMPARGAVAHGAGEREALARLPICRQT